MAEKIVQINHITKKYKECTVLDDVSLSIRIGDVIGLVGGNGAGRLQEAFRLIREKSFFQENEELRM